MDGTGIEPNHRHHPCRSRMEGGMRSRRPRKHVCLQHCKQIGLLQIEDCIVVLMLSKAAMGYVPQAAAWRLGYGTDGGHW